MTTHALLDASPALIRAYVAELVQKRYPEGVLAVLARPEWQGDATLHVDGATARVGTARSSLAFRELLNAPREERFLVVITDQDEHDLGSDLCAHLVPGRPRRPDLWEAVRQSFGGSRLDAMLVRTSRDLAEALLAAMPPEGWPPPPDGVVTFDAAMEALAERALDLPADRLDPPGVLEWAIEGHWSRLDRLVAEAKPTMLRWLGERTGPSGRCTLDVVRAGRGGDALALGVVAGLLAQANVDPVVAARAAGILAHRYGGRTPEGEVARRWSEMTRGLLESRIGRDRTLRQQLSRAEAILADAQVPELAARSDVLPRGYEDALRSFARFLRLAVGDQSHLEEVEHAFGELRRHLLADLLAERTERALMALRLARCLAGVSSQAPPTIAEAASSYARDGGWVDRARTAVWYGDPDEDVATAYREVYAETSRRRGSTDEGFASLLAEEVRTDAEPGSLLTVERVLPSVVLRLARRTPLLLLVVDGMSVAIAAEVAPRIVEEGWREFLPAGDQLRRGVLCALPTTTTVCRTSLLSGAVALGGRDAERAGLVQRAADQGVRAALFHQSDLDRSRAGEALPEAVKLAIQDPDLALVAAVLNNVDDALEGQGLGAAPWMLERIMHLAPLLHAARLAGRAVVITSDHGHVRDWGGGELRTFPGVQTMRWRPATAGAASPGEVQVMGARVATGEPVVLAWKEDLRYGPRRPGYHGGANPAEAVTLLLTFAVEEPPGWHEAPPQAPAWWVGSSSPVGSRSELASAPPVAGEEGGREGYLFDTIDDLAARLVQTEQYRRQRSLVPRGALETEVVERMVRALMQEGGRTHREQLASTTRIPAYRIGGHVRALQRMLNVDGYGVVTFDPDGETVVLDQALLREQFGV